jgi:hypothetical protein
MLIQIYDPILKIFIDLLPNVKAYSICRLGIVPPTYMALALKVVFYNKRSVFCHILFFKNQLINLSRFDKNKLVEI